MVFDGIGHVALFVPDLRAAERRYTELFGMDVAFREVSVEGEITLFRDGDSWADVAENGRIEMSFCTRNDVTVALHEPDQPRGTGGPVDHLNVTVPEPERRHICKEAPKYDCAVDDVPYDNNHRYITTPAGVTWELGIEG